jgi:hypothetical protein
MLGRFISVFIPGGKHLLGKKLAMWWCHLPFSQKEISITPQFAKAQEIKI